MLRVLVVWYPLLSAYTPFSYKNVCFKKKEEKKVNKEFISSLQLLPFSIIFRNHCPFFWASFPDSIELFLPDLYFKSISITMGGRETRRALHMHIFDSGKYSYIIIQ